ncbi:MAG: alpha,alpha-trehalase [Bacilli bacterium]|nr:alpha,alpha-trehalase [Bacilli bacterium]
MDSTHEYILKNWAKTIRDPKKEEDAKLSNVKLPVPYTTPCIDDCFKNFYYWDTYFTNIGLLQDGMIEQARNNLLIMKFFVDSYGFVPNADHLIFGSQPPFFTRGVYDLYKKTGDKKDIELFVNALITEMDFWAYDRMSPCGLNQYKSGWTSIKCLNSYDYFVSRVGGLKGEEKNIDKIEMARNFFAIGESGWDVNMRFKTKTNRFASLEFAQIDLNSILFDAEMKLSEMLLLIGRKEDSLVFLKRGNSRKEKMMKLMEDEKTGLLLDYNFVDKSLSSIASAASFYPFAMGISEDKEACLKLFKALDNEYGISTAPYRGEDDYLQWDYPHMWPSNAYFCYLALKNVGLEKEAAIIRKQYIQVVDKNYQTTGKLWEKYNTVTGEVSKTVEYETPSMMGWTAGIYEYFNTIND